VLRIDSQPEEAALGQVLDQDALYYPYMQIRDVNWLRTNLVLFPHVFRMVPDGYPPKEDPAVIPFSVTQGSRGRPLLEEIRLNSYGVYQAIEGLTAKFSKEIDNDLPSLERRFGREATTAAAGGRPFLINVYKAYGLFDLLRRKGLAWPGPLPADVEVHPRVGEAIMMTLAIASAKEGGLQVVTDNGAVHRCLDESDLDGAMEHWLSDGPAKPPETTLERRIALAVIERVPLDELTPERLAALSVEWEPRGRFLAAIRDLATGIPKMEDEARLREYIESRVDRAVQDWERDKANFSGFVRQIFPAVGKSHLALAAKRSLETMAAPAVTGTILGGLSGQVLLALGAGVGIGFVVEAFNAWKQVKEKEAKSPYRYLSMVQRVGLGYSISR
jgi:hypothetical protein